MDLLLTTRHLIVYLEPMQAAQFLAKNIAELRTKKRLSQQRLAALAEIPRTTLTNIESGDGNPSLSNLLKLSAALGVSVEELLSRPRGNCLLVPSDAIPTQSRSRGQATIFKLLPDKLKGMEIDRIELVAGGVMGGHPHLGGTKEYLTVIAGEVIVQVSGESYQVQRNDVFAFPGDQPHSYRNPRKTPSIALSVVIPLPATVD